MKGTIAVVATRSGRAWTGDPEPFSGEGTVTAEHMNSLQSVGGSPGALALRWGWQEFRTGVRIWQELTGNGHDPLAGVRSANDLRHTAATLMLAHGEYPKLVQERLGHADISMTLGLYGHVIAGMGRDAADRLALLVGS